MPRRSSSRAPFPLQRPSKSSYNYKHSINHESDNSKSSSGSSSEQEGRGKKGKVHTMRSLGIQQTRLKDILPGSERPHSSSSITPLIDPTLETPLPNGGEKDSELESQALTIRSARRTSRLYASRKRILHISLAGTVCVVLIVAGTVLGVTAYKTRGDSEGAEADGGSQLGADQAMLLQEGESAQAKLGILGTSTKAAEGHSETSITASTSAAAASEISSITGAGTPFLATATATSSPSLSSSNPASPTGTAPVVALPSSSGVYGKFPELEALLTRNREFVNDTEVEEPGFAYLGCADSRAAETTVLGAKVGDLFVAWIRPIRSLYASSNANATVTKGDVTGAEMGGKSALVEENAKINVERLSSDPSVRKSWQTYLDAQHNSTATAT
ncbi:hypothetical protein JCM21900_002255 [Sporobolomyces salmonicolor]